MSVMQVYLCVEGMNLSNWKMIVSYCMMKLCSLLWLWLVHYMSRQFYGHWNSVDKDSGLIGGFDNWFQSFVVANELEKNVSFVWHRACRREYISGARQGKNGKQNFRFFFVLG